MSGQGRRGRSPDPSARRSMTADWVFLTGAIVLEVAGTVSMKLSHGFSNALPSILLFLFYGASFTCLNFALRSIEVSVAYAIWSALGLVLVAAIGIVLLGEGAGALKLASIVLIVAGVAGLYVGGGGH
ncbi:MAG TPA: multidrug efflux SMR transporter [Burkholderiaceae bacterium]|nr:multidrug efflux SMR transporter [Burkholderiaceae bacterium]